MRKPSPSNVQDSGDRQKLAVSLKTLAHMLDAHRSTVHRWLDEAGVRPIVLGRGRRGAVRYWWKDIERWLISRERAG